MDTEGRIAVGALVAFVAILVVMLLVKTNADNRVPWCSSHCGTSRFDVSARYCLCGKDSGTWVLIPEEE